MYSTEPAETENRWYRLISSKERRPANAGSRSRSRSARRAYGQRAVRAPMGTGRSAHMVHRTRAATRDFFSFFFDELWGRSGDQLLGVSLFNRAILAADQNTSNQRDIPESLSERVGWEANAGYGVAVESLVGGRTGMVGAERPRGSQ